VAAIHPFRALRPAPERVKQVASPPYDVVNTEEARALAADNPHSFLRVSRPEMELPDDTDIYSDTVYERAAQNFERLKESCPLVAEEQSALYIYRLVMGGHTQTGIAAACSVDEYDQDRIKKHERTRRDKEDDRTRHILTLRAQTGPVFLTYQPDRRIDALVEAITHIEEPLYDFTADDGIKHTIWCVANHEPLARAFTEIPALYIADGHHRAASASRARETLRNQNPNHTGEEDYNRFLAVIFPADQMQILPYNRTVKDLNNLSPEDFLARVGERFEITENAKRTGPGKRGHFHLYLYGAWYGLTPKDEILKIDDPVSSLDVSILQDNLLDPILGIRDVRTDKRIDFVGGARGTEELERLVDTGRAAVAFALYPTTIEDLIRVSDANSIMPPKSTWFEPKLRDGILIHTI
jgi:uncharacterized protein (DUF1015 family)